MISHFINLSERLSFEPSNSKTMPLHKEIIFETLSRAQNSIYVPLNLLKWLIILIKPLNLPFRQKINIFYSKWLERKINGP
jgi:hypothetical protein